MPGGAAAGAGRSRPPAHLDGCSPKFGVYSLFPTPVQPLRHSGAAFQKVSEGVVSSVSGNPGGLQLDLFKSYSHQFVVEQKSRHGKMDDAKCQSDAVTCCGLATDAQRQMLHNVTSIMQPLTIKTETKNCGACVPPSPKKVVQGLDTGCSRTNPVSWTLGVQNVQVQVKREPQHVHMSDLVAVKLEQSSPGTKHDQPPVPASINNGTIPVGIAVARQRVGDAGLLAALSQKDQQQRLHDIEAAAMTVGVSAMGGALLHCEDRSTNQMPTWPVTSHAPPPAPPALWQYPAQMSMDGMMVGGMGGVGPMGGMGGVSAVGGGFQLVRDPASGALLLLPTPEQYPQTLVWGGCGYPAPLLLPQPPQSQLLLGGCGDLLTSTLHQHTQTHSTRLVTLAPPPHPPPQDKRKMLNLIAPHALIKIEEPEKQFVPDPPLLYYQPSAPPPQPFLMPQPELCRTQATPPPMSPPPPDNSRPTHRDASNQTDAQPDDDDDSPNHADEDEVGVACVGVAASSPEEDEEEEPEQSPSVATEEAIHIPPPEFSPPDAPNPVAEAATAVTDELLTDNSSSLGSHDLVIDSGRTSPASQKEATPARVDVSGLELLSNSIEQFETARKTGPDMPVLEGPAPLTIDTRTTHALVIKTSPKSPPRTADLERRRFEFSLQSPDEAAKPAPTSLDGLGLLCALAEQRFMEEVEPGQVSRHQVKSEPAHLSSPPKHERRHTRDGSPDRNERKRHRDDANRYKSEEERQRYKDKKRRREATDSDVLESYRRLAGDVKVPADFVTALEKDMRDRLAELQRQFDEKRAQLIALEPCAPSPTSSQSSASPLGCSSSQKRKVGRPKKVSSPDSTETIVAKKPKSKSSLVGYLLAAKSRLNMPHKGGIIYSKSEDQHRARTSKVRPKLKAEPKVKEYSEEDDTEWGSSLHRSASSSMESLHEVRLKNREKTDRIALKLGKREVAELGQRDLAELGQKEVAELGQREAAELGQRQVAEPGQREVAELEFTIRRDSTDSGTKKRPPSSKSETRPQPHAAIESRCTLTEAALDASPRVLTARGGLFYAGRLAAVQAPDVYAVTLDGERGNKPHILSREETLKDAILEVTPGSTRELPPGTRLCAYWSQQYRCLYPGTVAPDTETDDKFVAVEFDDGDSGRIALEDIRLLEPNYPVVDYDPNPLLTLGKRRRNTSVHSVEEKKNPPATAIDLQRPVASDAVFIIERSHLESDERHRERKKLKKHRKEKMKRLMSGSPDETLDEYIRKKKKKHKCYDEHCKHRRHHKKHHRKHRKRHHSSCKEHSSSSGDDNQRHKSSSDTHKSSNEDSGDSNDQVSTYTATNTDTSPDDNMKTVIKKTMVPKKSLVKSAVLDLSKKVKELQGQSSKDDLKDSGIGLDIESAAPEKKKSKRRTVSLTSSEGGGAGASKMAAFLPGGALWSWHGAAYRRVASRPRQRKLFYRAIRRGDELIKVGDSAVFLSTGRPDRPYIGRIESLWEARGAAMAVKVRWFYHPEETVGFDERLKYPGGLFESPHTDENDVQTISHKCEVLPLAQYQERMGDDAARYACVYDNNDLYYLVGHYDPTQRTIKMESDIPFSEDKST